MPRCSPDMLKRLYKLLGSREQNEVNCLCLPHENCGIIRHFHIREGAAFLGGVWHCMSQLDVDLGYFLKFSYLGSGV